MDNKKYKLRVKMCGNCHPHYNVRKLLNKINENGEFEYIFHTDTSDADCCLLLNGCQVACAQMPDFSGPTVSVAGYTVEDVTYNNETEFIENLVEKLRNSVKK